MTAEGKLDVPSDLRHTFHRTEAEWLASARYLLDLLCRIHDVDDLGSTTMLDVGCGTKFTKVLLDERRPIGRYVGVDVSAGVIDFLSQSVDDPRFAFHHLDGSNAMYNPDGAAFTSVNRLLPTDERFELISLFSVFTHLAPDDYVHMLRLLRNCATPDCTLVYSLFIEESPGDKFAALGEGMRARLGNDASFKDRLEEALRNESALESAGRSSESKSSPGAGAVYDWSDFIDMVPDRPLLKPVYSRRLAEALVDGTGWQIVGLHPPGPSSYIQHYFVCRPDESDAGR